jgi:hypothetical protein
VPSIQKRVVSAAEEIATLQMRVLKLETLRGGSGSVIASASSTTPIGPITATSETYLSPATSGPWAAIRPAPLLIIATYTIRPDAPSTAAINFASHVTLQGDAVTLAAAPYATIDKSADTANPVNGMSTPVTSILYYTPTGADIATAATFAAYLYGFVTASQAVTVASWSILVLQLAG